MKLLFTTLAAALLSSSAALAAPDASPAATPTPSAALVTPAATPAAQARPSEERLGLARRFVALTNPQENSLARLREMSLQAASWAGGPSASASDRAFAARFTDRVMTRAAPVIRAHLLSIDEVTALTYAREFSPAELGEMIAFAATPGGKHYFARVDLVDMDPNIMAQVMLMQEAMQPVMFEVRKEMCQEATAKRIAAGHKKAKCPLARAEDSQQG